MTISKTISRIRRHVKRNRKAYRVSMIFFLLGLIVTLQIFFQVAQLFDIFQPQTKNILCLSLLTALIVILIAYILLKNDLRRYKKYLKQEAPNFNIDVEEEFDEGWDEASKTDKD